MYSPDPSPSLIPSFVPHNAYEAQELHILQQVQHHTLSINQALYSGLAFSLPIPISWKLALYHFLNSLPIHKLSPMELTIIITLGPFVVLLFFLIIFFLVKYLITHIIPAVLRIFFKKGQQNHVFLELTFPHDTSKSSYATEQLYKLIHTVSQMHRGFLQPTNIFSLEIVSTHDEGIRYIIAVPPTEVSVFQKTLLSYLPGLTIKEIPDYLENSPFFTNSSKMKQQEQTLKTAKSVGVLEFKLSKDFTLPLIDQKKLGVHDAISFLTGNMTKPKAGEIIAFQIVLSTTLSDAVKRRIQKIKHTIYQGKQISPVLNKGFLEGILPSPLYLLLSPLVWIVIFLIRLVIHIPFLLLDPKGPESKSYFSGAPKIPLEIRLNPYEQELTNVVKEKLSGNLFETSIRCFILATSQDAFDTRRTGLISSFGQYANEYQSLIPREITWLPFFSTSAINKRIADFAKRRLANNTTILSSSELSDLYHFPNMDITRIEGLAKSKSHDLPPPVSMKRDANDLDITVGNNIFGGEVTPVGLAKKDRRKHTYITGKTGMGKSTIIKGMALQDIQNNNGVAVIDPHGDMVEHLLSLIPRHRMKDVIYLNPFDKAFPVGLNILSPGIVYADKEEEQLRIAGIVMAIFMKITPEKYWGQRMEHILRNAILTALQIPANTPDTPYISLYTIQKLLIDTAYRKNITSRISDPILKQFWEKEYVLYTKNKLGDIISPLTNKIGEFITDPLSRSILLQERSTINIADLMDQGKIVLVNLSKGNLGEERSAFFGTVIISLIQLATYARAQIPENKRRDFFVYIDEFQNFATEHFTELFSESRKYRVFFTPSHQNIAQIADPKVLKIITGNSGNYITLKGSPDDEKALLPIFSPELKEGQIVNLPPHHFFMKVTNDESEDGFSGITTPIDQEGDDTIKNEIIAYSRAHFATSRAEVTKQLEILLSITPVPVKKRRTNSKSPKQNEGKKVVKEKKKQLL